MTTPQQEQAPAQVTERLVELRTVPALLEYAAQAYAEQEALVEGGVRLTYPQLREAVEQASRAAMAHSVERGDRVAIWAPNCRQWIIAALGLLAIGATLVPLNTRYKGTEAADILHRSGARVLFTTRGFLGLDYVQLLREAGTTPADLAHLVLLDGEPESGVLTWEGYLEAGSGVSADELAQRYARVRPDDLSDIIYTSGTTGRPKGVMTTHGQTLEAFARWSEVNTLSAGDRYLLVNPFFHTFGYKAGFLACLLRGVTMLPEPVFDVERVMRQVAAERVTVLLAPPTVFTSVLNHPRRSSYDLSSLRLAGTGAAVVPVELIRRIRTELNVGSVFNAYGLTEASGVATICSPDADAEVVAHTTGSALPGTQVRVVDSDGDPLPAGAAGEIVVRGYNVMRGYLDAPDATREAVDDRGWLHTGDIGVLDERGNLKVTDRLKDMFIVGGFNAYPAEIESVLHEHPAVGEVAVVGEPDERLGEVGVAFVVARPDADSDGTQITAWARERLANFKVPRRVVFMDSLPRNASGKVLKGQLRHRMTGD